MNLLFSETAPQILKGLDNISGFEEQEVTMEVEVDKDHWKKNGQPIDAQWLRGKKMKKRITAAYFWWVRLCLAQVVFFKEILDQQTNKAKSKNSFTVNS